MNYRAIPGAEPANHLDQDELKLLPQALLLKRGLLVLNLSNYLSVAGFYAVVE